MVTQFLKDVRLAVARAMHPTRHERALRQVRAHAQGPTYLVICHGNICRSPYAAAVLAYRLRPHGIRVLSAGLIGPGRPSPAVARTAALARGIDLKDHRSQLVTPALLAQVDLVIVMDARQRAVLHHDYGVPARDIVVLGDLDPGPIPGRGIADPYDRPLAEFNEVYSRIDRCLNSLVSVFGDQVGSRRPNTSRRAAIQRAAEPTSARISLTPGFQVPRSNAS